MAKKKLRVNSAIPIDYMSVNRSVYNLFFTIVVLNINSLTNKLHVLGDMLIDNSIDMCCVTETWLCPFIPTSAVNIPGYKFFRHDSPTNTRKHGVGIYIKDSIKIGNIFYDHANTIGLYLPDFNLTTLVVYRPPSNSTLDNIALISFLEIFCAIRELILTGDFNLPTIDWSSDIPVGHSTVVNRFLDIFTLLGLTQWINVPTFVRSDNILDLVFTTDADRISYVTLFDPLPGCDHFPIMFKYTFTLLILNDNLN